MRANCTSLQRGVERQRQGEQGFMLVGLIVAIFFILLALSVAAPKVAQALRREKEVEAVHRGNQYVRAIRLYYRKFGHYPGSMEQLEKTNNIRFLRQRYIDPMTGKDDWRLIKVGEAKTTVKGFFGQPLAGLAPGLGTAAGQVSGTGTAGTGAAGTGQQGSGSAFGSSSPGSSAFGSSSPGSSAFGSSSPGTSGLGASSTPTLGGSSAGGGTSGPATLGSDSSAGSSNTSGIGSQSASTFSGGGAPFVGVGVPKEGDSITILNEQTTYNTWEFIYDPRIEQLYAKGALMGGGSTGLGANSGSASGFGSTPSSGFGTTPGSGFGTTPGSPSPTAPQPPPPQQ